MIGRLGALILHATQIPRLLDAVRRRAPVASDAGEAGNGNVTLGIGSLVVIQHGLTGETSVIGK